MADGGIKESAVVTRRLHARAAASTRLRVPSHINLSGNYLLPAVPLLP